MANNSLLASIGIAVVASIIAGFLYDRFIKQRLNAAVDKALNVTNA